MKWIRGGVAAVLGYVISQGLNAAFVYYWYVYSSSTGTALLALLTVVFFAAVGIATGYVVSRIAAPHGRWAGLVTGAFVAAVTVGNIVADVAVEPLWHKLIVLLLMAPAIAVASWRAEDNRGEPGAGSA